MSKPAKKPDQKVGAFILNNSAEYPYTVYVHVPGPNGKRQKVKINARFKHVSGERRIEVMDEYRRRLKSHSQTAANDDDVENDDAVDTVREALSFESMLLSEVLLDFKNVLDPEGNEVPCNDETKAQLLQNSWARDALYSAYIRSLASREDLGN